MTRPLKSVRAWVFIALAFAAVPVSLTFIYVSFYA